jgi:hypothetical protein
MIEISLRCDDVVEEVTSFTSYIEAEEYFYLLARRRTAYPSSVVATIDGDWRMIYRIDDVYGSNRWLLSLDITSGLPVKRRYIPSMNELTGRKVKCVGVKLSAMRISNEIYAKLMTISEKSKMPLVDIRRQAYNEFTNKYDTILNEVLL